MPGSEDHIILKNILRIKVRDPKTAHETQSKAIDWFNQEVLPMIETALDRLSSPGELIQLDQVQLDFGSIDLSRPSQELKLRVFDEVMQSLEAAVAQAKMGKEGRQMAQSDVDWQRFIQFLETGHLNWEVTDKDFGPSDLLKNLLETQPDRLKGYLPQLLHNRKAFERLSLQFDPALLRLLLDLLEPVDAKVEENFKNSLAILRILWPNLPVGSRAQALVMQILLFWQTQKLKVRGESWNLSHKSANDIAFLGAWLDFLQNQQVVPSKFFIPDIAGSLQLRSWEDFRGFLDKLAEGPYQSLWSALANLANSKPEISAILKAYLPEFLGRIFQLPQPESPDVLSELLPMIRQQMEEELPKLDQAIQEQVQELWAAHKLPKKKPASSKTAISKKKASLPEKDEREFTDLDPEGIYISNAGLVLLNPFFQHCFEGLGWMQNGEWKDAASQENGVMLLAYMASGEEEVAETMLPLPKLLCGMPIDEPVRMQVELDPSALSESDNLLTAANQYWEKAGKLDPAQFRAAFLQREGRLEHIESGWNLTVDRQTIDILIEFIPWGFGTIKLRWMKGLLTVEW